MADRRDFFNPHAMFNVISNVLLGAELRKARLSAGFVMYAAILIAGSIPNARTEIGHFASGLVLHSIAYSVITFLIWSGLNRGRSGKSVVAVLIVASMGALDEFVQGFFPYRTASFGDWAIDCAASLATAWYCWFYVFKWLPSPPPSSSLP